MARINNKFTIENKDSLLVQLRDFAGGPIIGMIISIFTIPITTRILAPEEYGKSSMFTLFQVLFLVIGLFGLDQGYVRFYNRKNIDKGELFQNVIFPPLFISFILILTCIIWMKPISIFLFGSVEVGLMIAFCFFVPVLVINKFLLLQIRMDLRGKVYSLLSISSKIVDFIVLILFLYFYQQTFRAIIYATIISLSLNTIICFIFSDKSFFRIKFKINISLQKELFKFCLPLVPAGLLNWILNSFDKVGLRTWSNFNQLGLYSAAFKIVALLTVFRTIFTMTWTPIAYKWYAEKVPNKKYEDVSTIILAIMVVLFSCVVVLRDYIMLFLGEEYRDTAKIFVFLLFVPVLYTVSETTVLGIEFSKKTIYILIVSIVSVLINLIGNYFFIPKYGAIGAAITTCFSYIIFFWGRTLFSRKLWFKFKLGKYIINIGFLLFFGINILFWENKVFEILLFIITFIYNLYLLKNVMNIKRIMEYIKIKNRK